MYKIALLLLLGKGANSSFKPESDNHYFPASTPNKDSTTKLLPEPDCNSAASWHATSPAMASQPHLKLYTDSTANGIKASMALQELCLAYEVEHIDISTLCQKEPWFLEINPNGRIPALIDTYDDSQPIRIFEGGSILQYLVERYDPEHKLSFPKGSREYWERNNWLFFQHGGKGRDTTFLQHKEPDRSADDE